MISLRQLILETAPTDYRGEHEAPSKGEAPMHNLKGTYPDDIYSYDAPKLYGDNGGDHRDIESINIIQSARDKPNKQIRIYRAVPDIVDNKKIKSLNYIVYYYQKFGFLPMKNEIVYDLQRKYDIDDGHSYDEQIKLVLDDVVQQIKELQLFKPEPIKINPGDWVTINRSYAKEHGDSNLKGYKIISKVATAKELFTDGNSIHEWGYDP